MANPTPPAPPSEPTLDTTATAPSLGPGAPAGQQTGTAKAEQQGPTSAAETAAGVPSLSSDPLNAQEPTPTTRVCATCGLQTNAEVCPTDGTPTVVRQVLHSDALVVRVGDVIAERYRVTGKLGVGGFGAVYAAEHMGTQQKIALKMLLSSGQGFNDAEARRFYREAQVTASLKHPNTVRVFDVGQTPAGALFIAMELLHGQTLEALLAARSRGGEVLSEYEAIVIAIGVLRSLQEAHGQHLVHRDLKPANIMLADAGDEDPVVKVLDFGIARGKDSSLTGAGTALGTPAYMSPEQCAGTDVDGRSDLYSLGIILYRCVAGTPPFSARNPLTLMFQHASAPLPDLRANARCPVSDAYVEVVNKSLAKRPEERFATARDMRLALEAILGAGAEGLRTPKLNRSVIHVRADDAIDVNAGTATNPATPAATFAPPQVLPEPTPSTKGAPVEPAVAPATAPSANRGAAKLVAGVAVAALAAIVAAWRMTASAGPQQPASAAAEATPPRPAPVEPKDQRTTPEPVAPSAAAPDPAVEAGLGRPAVPAATAGAASPTTAGAEETGDQRLRDLVAARLLQLKPEIAQCYNQALAVDPDLQGKVKLHFRLGPGGAIANVTQEGASSEFARCITERFLIARGFPEVPRALDFSQSYVFSRDDQATPPAKLNKPRPAARKAASKTSDKLIPD